MAFLAKLILLSCILLDKASAVPHSDKWRCENGKEILLIWKCDRKIDCEDSSDESPENCGIRECLSDEFKCSVSGACIVQGLVCNGEFDCMMGDDSDESEEQCSGLTEEASEICDFSKQMQCDNSSCIPLEWRCDGEHDCRDRADELDCNGCSRGNVSCGDTDGPEDCIDQRWICDGEEDCANGSDERDCPTIAAITTTTPSSCKVGEFMCHDGVCSPVQTACDDKFDCGGGEDEGSCHLTTCRTRSNPSSWHMANVESVCDHGCRETPQGPKCFCLPGYRLEQDGTRCRTSGDAIPKLFYAADNEIRQVELRPFSPIEVITATDYHDKDAEILSIDYDHALNFLLWADHHTGKIHALDDSKQPRSLTKVHGISGLAYDWITHNIYITYKPKQESTGHVAVIGFKENQVGLPKLYKHKFELIHVSQPMSIAIHPGTGKMVVADSGNAITSSSLIMADMDGDNVTTVVTRHAGKIHCVTIDYITDLGYWSESNSNNAQIWMIEFDTLVRKLLVSSRAGDITFSSPLSIAVFQDRLYFSDNETREIWRIDSLSGKPRGFPQHPHFPIIKTSRALRLLGVHITHPLRQQSVAAENVCLKADCSHICVLRPGGSRCLCPQGLVLEENSCVGKYTPTKPSRPNDTKNTFKPTASASHNATKYGDGSSPAKPFSKKNWKLTRSCPQPPPTPFTSAFPATLRQRYDRGFVIQYTCNSGFHIQGSTNISFNITCQRGGAWNLLVPACVGYTCDELNCGINGECKIILRHGAVCECNDGRLSYSTCLGNVSSETGSKKGSSQAATAVLVTLLVLSIILGLVLWRCLKKREYSKVKTNESTNPIYVSPSAISTSTLEKRSTQVEDFPPSNKDHAGISNPNYALSKTKVRLRPDDIEIDSGVDRSNSSLSSGDSPGVYSYTSLKETSDSQLYTNAEKTGNIKASKSAIATKDPLSGVRSAITSVFSLRKTQSQEHMLPPT